jgi:hypothetical protein
MDEYWWLVCQDAVSRSKNVIFGYDGTSAEKSILVYKSHNKGMVFDRINFTANYECAIKRIVFNGMP